MGNCSGREVTEDNDLNMDDINQVFQRNFLLPPNENHQEIDIQSGSKININSENEDFAYIGTADLEGYQQFAQKYQELEKHGGQFEDCEFRKNMDSLIYQQGSRYQYKWNKFIWKRPQEFYQGDYFLFMKSMKTFQYCNPSEFKEKRVGNQIAEGIEPDDIKQGELGDCYFLATLSAIAEFPWRIKELFVTKRVNEYGIYCVKMCHFGQWQTIVVDDHFPCNAQGPAFTRGNDNEIWVLILEKAWAKLFGCYERIEAGLTREALKSLTGAPTQVVWTDCPKDELWEIIQNGDQENFIMTCGSQDENQLKQAEAQKVGLVPGHAYTLIGCALYQDTKLILLRNPWGVKEWKGKWSDSDNVWTADLQQELNHRLDANDGTFYIEIDDFRKYFTDMQICYFKDGYQYTSLKVHSSSKHASLIKMKVKEASDYYISINQESKRVHNDDSSYQYSNCKLLIARIDSNQQYQWIAGKQYSDREFWVNAYLAPGNYLIYVKSYWFDQQDRHFVLSSYGKASVEFTETDKITMGPRYLEKIMMTHPMQKIQPYQKIRGIEKNMEIYMKEGFGMFWIKNMTKKAFTTQINLTKMNGLKLRKPFRGNSFELAVKPSEQAIALINADIKGYSLQYQESYKY